MYAIEVGKKYQQDCNKEGTRLSYNGGFFLEVVLGGMTEKEIEDISSATCVFGLTMIEDILFFTCRFGDSIDTSDTPFHFGIYTDDRINDMPKSVVKGEGLALNIIGVDYNTNMVKALRVIGLSTEFSEELIRICVMQSEMELNRNKYNKEFASVQRFYSSQEVFDMSSVKYTSLK